MIVYGVTREGVTVVLYNGPMVETKIVVGDSDEDLVEEAKYLRDWLPHGSPIINSQGWHEQLFIRGC